MGSSIKIIFEGFNINNQFIFFRRKKKVDQNSLKKAYQKSPKA